MLHDGNLLGRMIATFVLAQLRAELALSERPPRLHHLRREGGDREIGLMAEFGGRYVVAAPIAGIWS